MRSGGGSKGVRATLTSGSSVALATEIAGVGSGVKDHDASVTAWQDVHPHEKPWSPDDVGSVEIAATAWDRSAVTPAWGA